MKLFRKSLIAVGLIAVASSPALAVDGIVPFSSTITDQCVLSVSTPGLMAAAVDATSFDSRNAGGLSGSISATSTGGTYSLTAIAPATFSSAPVGAGADTTFNAFYELSGATTTGETAGATGTTLNPGLTVAKIDLQAQKGAGSYAAGAYAADVIVRCE